MRAETDSLRGLNRIDMTCVCMCGRGSLAKTCMFASECFCSFDYMFKTCSRSSDAWDDCWRPFWDPKCLPLSIFLATKIHQQVNRTSDCSKNDPKIAPGPPMTAPRPPQDMPRAPQDLPKTPRNLPKPSKERHRTCQDLPKTIQEIPGTRPRASQELRRTTPRAPRDPPGRQVASQMSLLCCPSPFPHCRNNF